ncbi:MAG: hypothetical protein JNM56_03725 [Planctomycetia bacterium]|nr:hypothetical protein [Planctomycetia bacterium]
MTEPNEATRPDLEAAARQCPDSLPAELWDYFRENRKWWLLPLVAVLLLLGVLWLLSSSAAAPFIYTVF